MRKKTFRMSLVLLTALALAACGQITPNGSSLSRQAVDTLAARKPPIADMKVVSGEVQIVKGSQSKTLALTIDGYKGTAIFTPIRPGHWDILVKLMNARGQVIYSGFGSERIKPGATGDVTITVSSNNGNPNLKTIKDKGKKNPKNNSTLIVRVNIPKPAGLILWSKLGSVDEVTNSAVGPNGEIVGTLLYEAAKFGNGFRSAPKANPDIPDNYVRYHGLNLGSKGCIEFWYHPDWNSSAVGHVINLLQYESGNPTIIVLYLSFNDLQGSLVLAAMSQNQSEEVAKSIWPSSTPGWITTAPFHVAIVWDGTASPAEQGLKFMVNGVEQDSVLGIWGAPAFNDWNSNNILYLGSRSYAGDYYRHNWEGNQDGVIDNIKIWNFSKTDFSDSVIE